MRNLLFISVVALMLILPSLKVSVSSATEEYTSENTLRVAWPDDALVGLKDADASMAHMIADKNFLRNILEALYELDHLDPARATIPRLASSGDWVNRTCFEVSLRDEVTFHDETPFNADAVVWNMERIHNLMWDHTEVRYASTWIINAGDYEPMMAGNTDFDDFDLSWVTDVGGGYRPVNIINLTEKVDDLTVRFHLNVPYASIKDLLATDSAQMISPTAHADMLNATFLPTLTELIGTGPFTFESYDQVDKEITLLCNEDYYRSPAAIKKLTFTFYTDTNAMNVALLSNEVDLIPEFDRSTSADIEADTTLLIESKPVSIQANWISFNHDQIDKTMRKALSYAYDYDYITTELLEEETLGERMAHPIPEGVKYTDNSSTTIVQDLDIARQTLIDAGKAPSGFTITTPDADWEALADSDSASYAPILQLNHTHMPGSSEFSDTVYLNIKNSFALVGVEVLVRAVTSASDYVPELFSPHTGTCALSWTPNQMDPTPYLQLIWHSSSYANFAHFYSDNLDNNVTLSYLAADETEKEGYVQDIQKTLEDKYAAIWHLQPRGAIAYREGWTIPDVNGLNIERYYNIYYGDVSPYTQGTSAGNISGFGTGFMIFSAMGVIAIFLMKKRK